MRKLISAVSGLVVLATLTTAVAPASAQDYQGYRRPYYHHYYHHYDRNCYAERRHAGNEGTALGAVSGGVLGGVIGHGLVGGLVGAGVGAVAGHAIAKSRVRC